MAKIKVTSPAEMSASLINLNEAIDKFEDNLLHHHNTDEKYYHLVVNGEYNENVCQKIQKLYIKAGWKNAQCFGITNNRTALELWR